MSYSINVSQASDAVAGLQFAEQNNIRLVIKNTGHEYESLALHGLIYLVNTVF